MGRRVYTNTHFNKLFAALDPSNDEIKLVRDCLCSLESEPLQGMRFRYDLYSGVHWVIETGRFVLVYQFSSSEVRAKEILLGERWL
jgi:hypothetical protein